MLWILCVSHHLFFLICADPPMKPQMSFIPSQPFLEGQDVDVTCDAVEGNPHISTYIWTLNGKRISISRKTISFKNITLEINQQRLTCRVNNVFTDIKGLVIISSTETFNVHCE